MSRRGGYFTIVKERNRLDTSQDYICKPHQERSYVDCFKIVNQQKAMESAAIHNNPHGLNPCILKINIRIIRQIQDLTKVKSNK